MGNQHVDEIGPAGCERVEMDRGPGEPARADEVVGVRTFGSERQQELGDPAFVGGEVDRLGPVGGARLAGEQQALDVVRGGAQRSGLRNLDHAA